MNRYRRYIPIIVAVLVALGFNLERFGIDLEALSRGELSAPTQQTSNNSGKALSGGNSNAKDRAHPSTQKWSSTNPEINLWHVFEGEINRKGKAVGYHSRPGGKEPSNARVVAILDKPNKFGVYTARIEVRDGSGWKEKRSTFFPDNMSQSEVIDVVLHAYKNSKSSKKHRWTGPSGLGFNVQGYTTNKGGINTAYPLYVK